MKKRLRPVLSVLLSSLFCVTALFGCAGENDSSAEGEQAEKTDTITVWCSDNDHYAKVIDIAKKSVQIQHPEFEIDLEAVSADQIPARLAASDEAPDLILTDDYTLVEILLEHPEELTNLADSGIDFSNFTEARLALTSSDGTAAGDPYALPLNCAQAAAYQRFDLLQQAGYSADASDSLTWEDYSALSQDLSEKTGHDFGMIRSAENEFPMILLQQSKTVLTGGNIADNPALRTALGEYQTLCAEGAVTPVGGSEEDFLKKIRKDFGTGSLFGGSKTFMDSMQNRHVTGLFCMCALPSFSGGSSAAMSEGMSFAVPAGSDQKEAVFYYLREGFASDPALYGQYYSQCNVVGDYLPALSDPTFSGGLEYFGGQCVAKELLMTAQQCPAADRTLFSPEFQNCLSYGCRQLRSGADLDETLRQMQALYDASGRPQP